MNQYQKVYMNQIHSSSLLGQLAQMWRSQMLCDALIRTGNVTTKAHRVVLVAACPMLQSMDNASVGSHLEVRLAADIKQEAVNSFLQYLYEGFMMLSEENCKDVEKVARLLQVDSVTKCCIDFYNCLQKKTGVPVYSNTQYKYSSADLLEFRHVRTTDLQKTIHERMMKRAAADSMRPMSPGGKRQRTQQRPPSPNIDLAMFGQKADDTLSMAHSYMGNQGADPWERVPRLGAVHGQRTQQPKPGVIEIVEDSLEILQTQPPDKDGNKSAPPVVQKSLAISVSSQINQSSDVHIVNVNDTSSHSTAATDGPIMSTGRDSITVSPLTVMPGSSSSSISSPLTKDQHKPSYDSQKEMSDRGQFAKKSVEHQSSTPQQRLFPISMSPANMSPISQVSQPKKSFAAGSASQAANMSQSHESSSVNKRPSSSAGSEIVDRPPSSDSGKDLGAKGKSDDGSASNSTDMAPDLSIVKVEPTIDDPGLDMYVDVPDESMIQAHQRDREHDDESDLEVEEASGDWSRDDMSNETGGNDQNNSWYIGQFKGSGVPVAGTGSLHPVQIEDDDSDSSDSVQTNWGIKLFRGWLVSVNLPVEFEIYTVSDLNDVLCQFYLEAKSKRGDPYQLCTLIDVKNALRGYLTVISQQWSDVWLDEARNFDSSNRILDSIREAIKDSIPKQKPPSKLPMTQEDQIKLIESGVLCTSNPLGLFRKVWFDLSLHLGCGGQAAMRSLTADMVVSEVDEQNRRFYRLNRCTHIEHARSNMEMQYWDWEARMYEIPDDVNCPVASMDLYLSKRNPQKNAFFQRPKTHYYNSEIWYESQVGHGVLASIMSRISEDAGLSRFYTNTSVRVSAADHLEKNGLAVDDVMGINPKNKTAKSAQQAMYRNLSTDELHFNSKTLHNIMYGFS